MSTESKATARIILLPEDKVRKGVSAESRLMMNGLLPSISESSKSNIRGSYSMPSSANDRHLST